MFKDPCIQNTFYTYLKLTMIKLREDFSASLEQMQMQSRRMKIYFSQRHTILPLNVPEKNR